MFHKMGLPLLVMFLAIGLQDGAAGLHLNNGPDDCGEDSHSSCDLWVKSGECEKDPEVKQSCSFSCSISGQLWEAAWTGNKSTVEITIAAGANPLCTKPEEYDTIYGLFNYTAIHMAAWAGHPGIINTLLEAGVDVNLQTTEGKTPIYLAAQGGNIDALDILIENNANVNIPDSRGFTPLMQGAWPWDGEFNITRALISANASIDVTGGHLNATALNYAIWGGNQGVALLLIEHNANVNIPAYNGETPLMQAARKGELNITRALIKANASIDVTGGSYNATALYSAVLGGNQDVLLLLIEHNANVNIPNSLGLTPLMSAVLRGELDITRTLIKANASLDVTGGSLDGPVLHYIAGYYNGTALHYAATRNNQDLVVLLMDNGADSCITNTLGITPADLARSEGHNQLADLIESYPTTHRLILSR